jgi:nucleoside-diphosphate-sugar epimerase
MSAAARFAALGGKRIIVAGASGFIGRRFIGLCRQHGQAEIAGFVRSTRAAKALAASGALPLFVETADLESIADALAGADAFVNLAYDFTATADDNIAMHRRFLDAAEEAGVRRVAHLSSIAVYDGWPGDALTEESPAREPRNPYKRAKIEMDRDAAARRGRIDIVTLQPTCVYGPGSAFWTDAPAQDLVGGGVFIPMDGAGAFNGVFVDDVAEAIAAAVTAPQASGERFILNGADAPTWRDLYDAVAAAIGRSSAIYQQQTPPAPPPVTFSEQAPGLAQKMRSMATRLIGREESAALKLQALKLKSLLRRSPRHPSPHETALFVSTARPDTSKAQRILGWTARTSFTEGMRATAPYLKTKFGAL